MNNVSPTIADAVHVLETLSADEVESRLLAVRAEEKSLCVLLRTIRARERAAARKSKQREAAR
jgi:hypothetical protein